MEADAETRFDNPRRILKDRAVVHEEIRLPLEQVNFVGPPCQSYKLLRLVFLNFQNLGTVVDVELVQFKKNFLRGFEALSRRVLHLYSCEVDLTGCDSSQFADTGARGFNQIIDLVTEWVPLLHNKLVVIGTEQVQESVTLSNGDARVGNV